MLVWFDHPTSSILRDGLVLCDNCDDVNPVRNYSSIKPDWYMKALTRDFIAYCPECKVKVGC